jgi:hypothetical protein
MNFRLGLPETTGLAVLGGTIGALLGGAASGKFDLDVVLCALAGAALPFVATLLPRLGR